MSVGDPGGTPFKIPLTSTAGSGGSTIVSSGTKGESTPVGTAAVAAPVGDAGATLQLNPTKTYIGGDADTFTFHNFNLGSSWAPTTESVHTEGLGGNASVFTAHSSDTLFNASWDGHFTVSSVDWDI